MSQRKAPRARASRNCGNCRAIKRRCDKQTPHCGQCIRMREKCPGYRDEWELVFRDQTNITIQRSKKNINKNNHSPPPCRGLSPSADQIGVNYFFHHFVTGDHCPSRGYLNYIPAVFGTDGYSPTLVSSMAAVGLVALANSMQQPDLASRARIKYSEAIRSVNTALACPVESVKDSTLMSVISLGVFEHFSSFESWVQHVQGAAAVVTARGKSQFSSPVAILMFNQVRADLIVACMHTNKPFPAGMRQLQDEASKHTDTSNASWLLGVIATRCVSLLWDVTKHRNDMTTWSGLLEEATKLQRNFQYVLKALAVQEPYTTTLGCTGDPTIIYNGRIDVYKSTWAIRVWNNARNIQMIISEIECFLLNKILSLDLAPATRAHTKLHLKESLLILSNLGYDMIASVPQALGMGFSSDTRVTGGYVLAWGLYMVGKSPSTAERTRKWIIGLLTIIVKNSGITIALQLLNAIIKIDQLDG